ncbi:AcrR family transcriptional regulator [Azospirillum agricola]|uniref:hypothetical protein n=1 Tax=Azospirillum agricola TaxID=1720247 RepID=UPI001AE93094|nr:hypothetical protein [Azospirillum agricola]MBP2232737.1 AcrR family transcriptional regulator [Azospirillum agricola]
MPLDALATPAAAPTNTTRAAPLPRWAEEPPAPPDGSLVPGSRFAEEQWVMAAGMLARGASFLHVARALGCSRTTLWRAYYGSQALRARVWWERQALNREAELRLSSLRDLVAQQVERLVAMGDPATVRWAADRLGLFGAPELANLAAPAAPVPPSPVSEDGFGAAEDPAAPPMPAPVLAPALDDAVPGAFRERTQPDPAIIAAILAQPEADGPKGVYPWTLNPDDAYPSLGSAEERRGKGPCGRRGGPGG